MVIDEILRLTPKGTIIPKPRPRGDHIIKGLGKRRGETSLIYTIPNHNNPRKPCEKGVTVSELEQSYARLIASGTFTREWFVNTLPECNAEGSCNFTTIGGLFVLLGRAVYEGPGIYRRLDYL
ncbi:MAG TPA: hypothetical protein VM537_02070 [Anaerolineae bacterium]|nr:hypothetical protein [Anaerolineae bacterium]